MSYKRVATCLMAAYFAVVPMGMGGGIFAKPVPSTESSSRASPSFDCARAKSALEKMVCARRDLAVLDREVAAHYAGAMRRLDPAGKAALKADQLYYLRVLTTIAAETTGYYERVTTMTPREGIASMMKARADLLRRIRSPDTPGALSGRWTSLDNSIILKNDGRDRFSVEGSGADPYTARWICTIDQGAAHYQQGVLTLEGIVSREGSDLRFTRKGDMLVVEEIFASEDETSGYCGYRGTFAGAYFFTG